MTARHDDTTRGEPPDDVDPDAVRAALAADTDLDAASASRLRHESRRTRPQIERRLVTSGHLGTGGPPDRPRQDADGHSAAVAHADAWRDLHGVDDDHVDLLDRIDALHERRLRSPSPRERQASTRVLAEALHRIVDGYEVEVEPAPRLVAAVRGVGDRVGATLSRVAAHVHRPTGLLRWWASHGRWVRLPLALLAAVLLATGALRAGTAVVALRSLLAVALYSDLPDARPGRVLGYDPWWAASVIAHVGDAAVLAGLGYGLHVRGHDTLGAVTAFVALFSLLASMLRIASGHHGFRLERLWFDRVVTTVMLVGAAAGAAFAPAGRPGTIAGVPVTQLAVAAVTAIGVGEIGRTIYWASRRRRLFRQGPHAGAGPADDVLVAHTADAVVMNIPRRSPRTSSARDERATRAPGLRVVGGPDR